MSNIITFKDLDQADIRKQIESSANLAKIVSDSMGIERFTEAALQLLKTPGLAACTQESVLGGLLKAAMFNFRLSPELGQCWLIPRNVKMGKDEKGQDIKASVATFQVGYRGWQELSFRSGEIESFSSAVVYENDVFDYEMGTNSFLKYKACKDPKSRGKKTHVWASATLRSGRTVFHVVDIEEVERHRKMSDTQKTWEQGKPMEAAGPVGIWAAHYDQMAKRIPMRYLCTLQLPKSEFLLRAAESDGGVTNIHGGEVIEVGGRTIEDAAETFLHEDYVAEIKQCKTKAQLKTLFDEKKNHLSEDVKPLYFDACVKHGNTLTQ